MGFIHAFLAFLSALGQPVPRPQAVYCIAEAIYSEARSEPDRGQVAVAFTVMNRVRSPDYPKTPCKVVFQPVQYAHDSEVSEPEAWKAAVAIATSVALGIAQDPTEGATHFVTTKEAKHVAWFADCDDRTVIGAHVFCKGG